MNYTGETTDKPTVATPCAAYKEMSIRRELIRDLLGGTLQMRKQGEKWLPREPREKQKNYDVRLSRSFLYGGYKDTVRKISGRPFIKPPTIKDEEKLPENLIDLDNIDNKGSDIGQFSKAVFYDAINNGLTHILIEFPKTIDDEGKDKSDLTLADEEENKIHPYFVHIKADDLIGWRSRKASNGSEILTQIRIKETVTEPDGDYGEKEVEYMRVYTETTWELHRKQQTEKDGEKWILEKSGMHTFGAVPLITYYTNRTGFMTADPALEDLAWLNLMHWQSQSDQRNILRVARVGILCGSGFTAEEIKRGITIGPNEFIVSTNENAKVFFAEHSGKSIAAGKEDIEMIETRMEVLGMQPYVKKGPIQTATGQKIDESRTQTDIHTWIRDLENELYNAFQMASRWVKKDLPKDFKISIFSEFSLLMQAAEDIELLFKMVQGNKITHRTFLLEVKKRGLLDEDVDVDEEIDSINQNFDEVEIDEDEEDIIDDENEDDEISKQPKIAMV